jgi:hypothetical protein
MHFIPLSGKSPIGPWKEQASDDPCEIEAWKRSGHNLGLPTGRLNRIVVRDYDGPLGLEIAREEYRRRREFFQCLVKTPNGLHVYLRQPEFDLRNSQKIEGEPVDHRGEGGYVVSAGSTVNGKKYEFVEGHEFHAVEDLPVFPDLWLPTKKEVIVPTIEETDVLRRITRARLWLLKAEPAISGQRGHAKLFYCCCVVFTKFGLSMDQAWPLLLEYNARCVPPFSEKELRHKLEDAKGA